VGEITVRPGEANLSAKVTALDADGNPTTFDAVPTWESSDESVARPNVSEDGYSATFEVGEPGAAAITVTGVESTADPDNPTNIVMTGLITVAAADAVSGSVEFATDAPTEGE